MLIRFTSLRARLSLSKHYLQTRLLKDCGLWIAGNNKFQTAWSQTILKSWIVVNVDNFNLVKVQWSIMLSTKRLNDNSRLAVEHNVHLQAKIINELSFSFVKTVKVQTIHSRTFSSQISSSLASTKYKYLHFQNSMSPGTNILLLLIYKIHGQSYCPLKQNLMQL